ncbi:MAG: serine hydrolase domain-containing protein [Pseudomonadota bacterium]|nr:serine hydrolase domain-containing protein [Pseudomonadota bacterium]MEC9392547.1 serine hydrolase domain-containing protein [Pseudomonadota bacterium]MEC9458885.1 serine hydrolase domain-containing protein [Pseudomonadota bacterium]
MYKEKISTYLEKNQFNENLGFDQTRLNHIPEYFSSYLKQERIPSFVCLVARRGEVGHYSHQGFKNIETKEPIDENTIFRIYSMTKPITSVAIMMLYERGLLRLEHELFRYLPEFANTEVWESGDLNKYKTKPMDNPILIRDLLTHTAGFTYDFMLGHPAIGLYKKSGLDNYIDPETQKEMDLAKFTEKLSELPLLFQPGEKWHYSCAIDVLGRVVEVVSGQSLDDFLHENIFKPLEMTDTSFYVDESKHERFSDCYQTLLGSKEKKMNISHKSGEDEFSKPRNFLSGGGGLCSTISDYANFCQMLLNKGNYKGNQILSPTTVEFMTLNHLPENQTLQQMGDSSFSETRFDGAGFGLGFSVITDQVGAMMPASLGSFSWGGMASTFFWIDPKEDLFSILLTQLIPSGRYPIRPQAQTLVYAAIKDLKNN